MLFIFVIVFLNVVFGISEEIYVCAKIDHFYSCVLSAWPLDKGEARGDLILIETSLLFLC